MQPHEPHRYENQPQPQMVQRRAKAALETPIVGRFWGENKRLIFAPPLWYDSFVVVVTLVGALMALLGLTGEAPFLDNFWFTWVGTCVFLAGIWALLSSERMVMDLRARTYWRREGQGPFKRTTSGSLNEIEAIAVQASEYPHGIGVGGRTIMYRIVLHWRNNKEPLLIADKSTHLVGYQQPVNAQAGDMLKRALRYSQESKIQCYDNTFQLTRDPLRAI